ncbi:sensor histidine kinase [Halobellus rufus]|uniref:sensor histidine kinase n=1 Tax=Halobellus rufus TaxID=1448860 RepID=UPI0006786A11|nr:PAS domain-containing sensor histidine kinase [Halobellus rufus]
MCDSDSRSTEDPPEGGYRTLIDNFPNGVIVLFDSDLRYRIVGPEVLPFSKREAATMVGKDIFELFPSETAARLEPPLESTLEGSAESLDVEFGEHVHHLETAPVEIDGDEYGVLVTQDVSEARETERTLKRQNERLDQFASMISHDLRNPLNVAAGRLELFRETNDADHLTAIEDSLDRIDELTTDLTGLARSEGSVEDYETVSLDAVARSAWKMIDTREATLETEPCSIAGDESQLQALFENLFRNAVGHGGASVTVRVGPLADGFYVEDSGKGIPAEKRDAVFEHGFTTGYSGTGTGLTIVQRIAAAHGFDVSLLDGSAGGARFEFHERDGESESAS